LSRALGKQRDYTAAPDEPQRLGRRARPSARYNVAPRLNNASALMTDECGFAPKPTAVRGFRSRHRSYPNLCILATMSISPMTCDSPSALRAHLKQGGRWFARLAFSGADLSSLDLSGCTFEDCDLSGIDLRHADVRDTRWARCRMAQARMDGVKANGATFTACDLANTEWQRARIDGSAFSDCRLTGAQLSVEPGLIGAMFAETRLVAARIIGLSFRKMTLDRLDFSEADLRGCDFREAVFSNCSLRDASFKDCRFKAADLRGCDLGVLSLAEAKRFEGATISQEQAADILTTFGFVVA
jgi:uncharacterized protein YjbI with pentapeptide repeats